MIFELNPDDLLGHHESVDGLLRTFGNIGYRFYHQETLLPFDDLLRAAAKVRKKDSINVVAIHADRKSSAM
jgi:hypothetical protein